jgi:hypothetical protein
MKKYIFIIILSSILGALIYKKNWFPISLYRTICYGKDYLSKKTVYEPNHYFPEPYGVFYIPYFSGMPLFSNRPYHDSIGSKELENSYVIQIPRHFKGNLKIEINDEVLVYRILSDKNDNSLFSNWETTNIKIKVKGDSGNHTEVVKKKFNPGVVKLNSGGPKTSSPIIIKSISNSLPDKIKINGILISSDYGLRPK